jgi:hypothetical protein
VKQGGLEVLPRVPVHRRREKPASFLRAVFSISLVEASALSISPNVAKSLNPFKSVE